MHHPIFAQKIKKTNVILHNSSSKKVLFMKQCGKILQSRKATNHNKVQRMCFACCKPKAKNTLRIFNIYYLLTATIVIPTPEFYVIRTLMFSAQLEFGDGGDSKYFELNSIKHSQVYLVLFCECEPDVFQWIV